MQPRNRQQHISDPQAGFSLIETIVAVTVLFLAVVIGMQFLFVKAATITLNERKHQSEEAAEAALNALAARASTDLAATTPSFSLQSDGSIVITQLCADSSCDVVFSTTASLSSRTSLAAGVPWSARWQGQSSGGQTWVLVRRWRFDPIDPQKRLYRLTVVVLSDDYSPQPLSLRQTEVVLNSQ